MDRLIIDEKLESLRRCIRRIEDKKPARVEELANSLDMQDILVLNLTRAVQLCIDIGSHIISASEEAAPQTMSEVFAVLHKLGAISLESCEKLQKAVGFRNIAVHNYGEINWQIVFAICETSLDDFTLFARQVSVYTS